MSKQNKEHPTLSAKETTAQQTDEDLMYIFSRADGIKNQQAFEVLYQRHKGPLYRFIKKSINLEQDAKQVFQELWFKIIKNKKQFNTKQKFTTWAYTIARRLLIDQFRINGRMAELNRIESTPENEVSEQPLKQPENEFETRQMAKDLNHAISLLPHQQRQVFVMKHESGLSIKEIAEVTESPHEQVKSQYRYAVQKIKTALERFL